MNRGSARGDTRPIWIQLSDEYRRRIAAGEWRAGARIPSVRELALESGVNPNTVQRALAELDARGLTAAERTTGRFVTVDAAAVDAVRADLAGATTDEHIRTLRGLGIGIDDALRLLTERWPLTKGE
ncbi:GntR family transcriptional regulator [Schaalia naturae]|uniref:GntR family transcriptional regulator n=1 Tax=Schaalia naturae TaxID=635203 RepID=A0ABW2SMB9_9ACTO